MNVSQQDIGNLSIMGEETHIEHQEQSLDLLDNNDVDNDMRGSSGNDLVKRLSGITEYWLRLLKRSKAPLIVSAMMLMSIGAAFMFTHIDNSEMEKLSKECKQGWINISGSCFLFAPYTCAWGCTWEFSENFCKNLGSILAEPRDEQVLENLVRIGTNDEITKNKNYWIGLRKNDGIDSFHWATNMEGTQANISAKFWAKGEPSHDGEFVHLSKGMELDDMQPINANVPICQKPASKGKKSCGQDWFYKGGKCFKFLINGCLQRCDWYTAIEKCNELSSTLAEDEIPHLIHLARILKTKNNYWLGYKDKKKTNNYTGYVSGKDLEATNYFAQNEPSHHDEECLELNSDSNWMMNDKGCKYEEWITEFQPLCQYDLSI